MKDKIGFGMAHLEEAWRQADVIGREFCRDLQTIYQGIAIRDRRANINSQYKAGQIVSV